MAGNAYVTQVADSPTRKALINLYDLVRKLETDLAAANALIAAQGRTITTLSAAVDTLQQAAP